MKSFSTVQLSRWGVSLAIFGFVVGTVAYASGQPKLPLTKGGATPKAVPEANALGPTGTTSPEARIAGLEKRATADAHRIHALEVSVKNLEYAVAHLPKPPPSTAPFCATPTVSKNPQGGTRDCNPYRCDGAAGTCTSGFCASVDDCSDNSYCNQANHCINY